MQVMGVFMENLKQVVDKQLERLRHGISGWTYGYRNNPISVKPEFHNGVDLPNPAGYPIHAPYDGTVLSVWLDTTYGGGNCLVLEHPSDDPNDIARTGYAHLSKYADGLKPGMRVKQGDLVAYVGTTGMSTGPHLHFTCRKMIDGKLQMVDPLPHVCAAVGYVEMPIPDHSVG